MTTVKLTRADVETRAESLPRSGTWKSQQWILTDSGTRLLVKDVRYCAWPYRYTVGRLLLRREAHIYERLSGLPFVPRFIGRLDADALVFEQVDGVRLSRLRRSDLEPEFYDRLQGCVDRLHARGVVHLDLRHRSNILMTASGEPRILDFESARHLGTGWLARRLLLPLLGGIDHSAVLKFRLHDFPEHVSAADRARYRRFLRVRSLWPFIQLGKARRWQRRLRRQPGKPMQRNKPNPG